MSQTQTQTQTLAERLSANWNYPTQVLVGPGRHRSLPDMCLERGFRRPLLVTDPGLRALPMVSDLVAALTTAGLEVGIFSEIKGNPTGEQVEAGVQHYVLGRHDSVIALGGGSALDCAKAIALMVGQDRPLWDFEDEGDNWQRVKTEGMAPVIAIPTTAGTGSEVGRASVITHVQEQRKVIIFHPKMLPATVLLDGQLCIGLPPGITAATGMDALSHCMEAFCANYYHPMAEGIALEGMRLIRTYLPRVHKDGTDLEARQHMLVASAMGATAFQRGLGGMHAIAHSLGALYDAHHGLLNAVLMPYILVANRPVVAERMVRLARLLGLPRHDFDAVLQWVLDLREQLGIPHSLADMGLPDIDLDRVAAMAVCDPSAGGNPVVLAEEEYRQIGLAALNGDLDLARVGE
ncbi:MAG: iron-containing alcohol dehydrogenase [Oleiphilaceae bacterium]|nr:iron-containing alcohol dehydrogenase [Oleiphilaceae bacterium]